MLGRPRRATARIVLAGSMVVPAVAVVATAAGAVPADRVSFERRWDVVADALTAQNVRLGLDAHHRVAYAFSSGSAGLSVRAYDLDTRTPRGAVPIEAGVPAVRGYTPLVVDETHGVAVLAPLAPVSSGPSADAPAVKVYASRGTTLTEVGAPPTRFPPGYLVVGMAVDAPRGRMLVLGAPSAVQTSGVGLGNVLLDAWRLADLAQGRIASDAAQPLRVPPTCGQPMSTAFPAGIMPSADGKSVYFGCLSNRGVVTLLGPNAGDVAGVAQLDLAAAATGAPSALRFRPVSGNYAKGDSFAVPRRGRFVLVANNAVDTTIKVYDAAHDTYVGNVGLDSEIAAIGFDPASGRGYYVNGAGLGVFDAAATPVNQGVVYPEFAPLLGVSQRRIDVDPATRRVFVPTADDVVNATKPWIAILHDGTAFVGIDVDTIADDGLDVAEQPGVYESARSVDAGALGAEYRMVGGPTNLIFNTTHGDTGGIVTRPGTRWLQMAATRSVRMTPDEASAQVVTMRYDDATATDASNTHLAAPLLCTDFGAGKDVIEQADTRTSFRHRSSCGPRSRASTRCAGTTAPSWRRCTPRRPASTSSAPSTSAGSWPTARSRCTGGRARRRRRTTGP